MSDSRPSAGRGATLLELMICMVILVGVIIVFATVFPQGYRLGLSNLNQNKAASLANGVMEEIKALPFLDATYQNGGQSQVFSVAALAGTPQQNGWVGIIPHNTNAPANSLPIQVDFGAPIGLVNFPHTIVTLGPQQPALAGDQGTFCLPVRPTDTPIGVSGIEVDISPMSLKDGTLVTTLPALSIITATIRVTVVWSETRATAPATQNKSVTLTGYVSHNTSQ